MRMPSIEVVATRLTGHWLVQIEGPMNEAIDLKVVHNYGHGGAGITLHWGCAGDTVALARQLL